MGVLKFLHLNNLHKTGMPDKFSGSVRLTIKSNCSGIELTPCPRGKNICHEGKEKVSWLCMLHYFRVYLVMILTFQHDLPFIVFLIVKCSNISI